MIWRPQKFNWYYKTRYKETESITSCRFIISLNPCRIRQTPDQIIQRPSYPGKESLATGTEIAGNIKRFIRETV